MDARRVMRWLGACLLSLATTAAQADRSHFDAVAAYVGVPPDILYAMALAESGRVDGDQFAPWPWTLNIAGEAHYYPDRASLFAALMAALQAQELRIDVGPLQLNWYWQFERIASPWRLTDPVVNAKLAAVFLKEQFREGEDWWLAVGRYHRPRDATAQDRAIREAYRTRVQHLHDQYVAPSAKPSDRTITEVADAR
ncbi:lytic transglycosylase domain-containing protein [Haliea salexigens]|uniref:lytic transglycosylase domain-containing protein n=1 Tax=Haliea salexigens TaxID=287487 RepID=UPI0003F5D5D5|nr:lytic transglycosylase domain-containing protein [Haliea salexigens]